MNSIYNGVEGESQEGKREYTPAQNLLIGNVMGEIRVAEARLKGLNASLADMRKERSYPIKGARGEQGNDWA